MEAVGTGGSLRDIIDKLGHSSEQIRSRSLKSILFKLDNDLIVLEQLWEDDAEIFPLLLEWFNQPSGMHVDVLRLLKRMCHNHLDAAGMLAEAGGVAFLQEMKRHAAPALVRHIHELLDILLTIPRNYKAHSFPITTTVSTVKTVQSRSADDVVYMDDKDGWDFRTQDASLFGSAFSEAESSSLRTRSVRRSGIVVRNHSTSARNSKDLRRSRDAHISSAFQDMGCAGWEFPLVLLSREDNQLLFELDVKLKMTDKKAVAVAMIGLTHDVLDHFPAEAILQKPDLFRNLLGLMQTTDEDGAVDRLAVAFFHALGTLLKQRHRLLLHRDFCRNTAPRAVSRAGRDATEESKAAFVGKQDTLHGDSQTAWWSPGCVQCGPSVLPTHQAAHLLFSRTIPLLQDRRRLGEALAVLRIWLPLLYVREVDSYPDPAEGEPADEPEPMRANVHVERLREHLQAFTAVIAYHGKAEVLASRVLMAMLPVLLELIHAIPSDVQSRLLPTDLVYFVVNIVTDPYVDLVESGMRQRFAAILKNVEPHGHSLFTDTATVWHSVQILREHGATVQDNMALDQRLDLLLQALPALAYESSEAERLVKTLVSCIKEAVTKRPINSTSLHEDAHLRTSDVLLRMLASSDEVREILYDQLARELNTISDDDSWQACAQFLANPDFVYEFAFNGLQHPKTARSAANILSILMHRSAGPDQGDLTFVLPLLIPHADHSEVGSAIHSLTTSVMRTLPREDYVLTLCGLVMHSSTAVRLPAAKELLDLLKAEGCVVPVGRGHGAEDPLDNLSADASTLDTGNGPGDKTMRPSCFEREEAIHLVRIFQSRTLKESIRLAAAEQILHLMEDGHFLSCLMLAGLLDAVFAELECSTSVHVLVHSLRLFRTLLRQSLEARSQSREWKSLKLICPFVFSPDHRVRAWTAVCLSHLVFANEHVRGKDHRSAEAFETELVLPFSEGSNSQEPIMLPAFFSGKILPSVPATFYTTRSQKYPVFAHSEVVARAVQRMEDVSLATQSRRRVRAVGASENNLGNGPHLPQLDPDALVAATLEQVNRAVTHDQFLVSLGALQAVCCVDAMMAEAFLRASWQGAVERILGTLPTSFKDDHVLEALLDVIGRAVDTLHSGRVAPSQNIRFLLQCIKHCLVEVLQDDVRPLNNARRGGLKVAILRLIHKLLEQDQNSGAFVVTPSLQRTTPLTVTIAKYCAVPKGRGLRQGSEQTQILVNCLKCCQLLTREADWLAHPITSCNSSSDVELPALVAALTDLLREHTWNNVPQAEESEFLRRWQSFEGKGVAKLALSALAQCLAGNREIASRWREAHIELHGGGWLDRFLQDREAEVRASALSLLSTVAARLVDTDPHSLAAVGDEGSEDVSRPVLAHQVQLLDTAVQCALDPQEADIVRQQALLFVVHSTSPSKTKMRLRATSTAKEFSMDSLQSSNTSDHATASASATGTAGIRGQSAQERFIIDILDRRNFISQVLAIATEDRARDTWSTTRLRSTCVSVLKNLASIDPALTASLFEQQQTVAHLVQLADVEKLIAAAVDESLPLANALVIRGSLGNDLQRPPFQRAALFASQWLCTIGPSAFHGAAAICDLLRGRLTIELSTSSEPAMASMLLGPQQCRALVSILRFRPSTFLSKNGVHLEHSWEHKLLTSAEVDAKQASCSLLCQLLLVPSATDQAAAQLLNCGVLRGVLLMIAPSYPPRVRYLACTLLARVMLGLEHRRPLAHSRGAAREPGAHPVGAEGKWTGEDDQLYRELARAVILYFNELFSPREGVHVDSQLGLEAHRDAVVAGLSGLVSWSRAAKAYALESSFATTAVSTLDDRVSQLSLESLAAAAGQKQRKRGQLAPPGQGAAEVEVVRLLVLLKNLLFEAEEGYKERLVEAGLPAAVSRLLSQPAAREHAGVLRAGSQVLVNMVAGCASGQAAMARAGEGSGVGQGATLLQRITKLALRGGASAESLRDSMCILGSCAGNSECMHAIMKSTLVERMVGVLSDAADAKDAARAHAALILLLGLSATDEGRATVLQVVGALGTISRARGVFVHQGHLRYHCSLSLRNLAFSPEAKAHFAAQEGALDALLQDLDGGMTVPEADHCRAHAANALWALIYNCQKTRAYMRKKETLDRITKTHQYLQTELENTRHLDDSKGESNCARVQLGDSRRVYMESALDSLGAVLKLAHGTY